MIEQKRKDQVMAVRSLIKRLLVYGKERRQENELLDREEQEWQGELQPARMKATRNLVKKNWKGPFKWPSVYMT